MRIVSALCAVVVGLGAVAATAGAANCTVLRTCSASGACKAGNERIAFEFEPKQVNRAGDGEWTFTYNGRSYQVEAASEFGPFLWAEGSRDIQSLMFSDDKHMLWHSAKANGATIRFMACEEG